jgi:hypothetical protein
MWDWLLDLGGDAVDVAADSGGDAVLDYGTDAVFDYGADLGDFGDVGEWYLDTATGDLVSADEMQAIMDLDLSGSGSGPVGDVLGPQNYDWDAASLGEPGAGFATPDQIAATAPYNASSGLGLGDWAKALAQGLSKALGSLGGGLGGPGAGGGAGGGGLPMSGGLGGMMSGDAGVGGGGGGVPGMQGPQDVSGLQGLVRPGTQEALAALQRGDVGAALQRGQAEAALAQMTPAQRAQLGMQSPIDRGPDPVKFTPLAMPTQGGPMPMAGSAPPAQRLSGLQRLALEKLG